MQKKQRKKIIFDIFYHKLQMRSMHDVLDAQKM